MDICNYVYRNVDYRQNMYRNVILRSSLYKDLLSELSVNEQKENINWIHHFDELKPHNAYKLGLLVQ